MTTKELLAILRKVEWNGTTAGLPSGMWMDDGAMSASWKWTPWNRLRHVVLVNEKPAVSCCVLCGGVNPTDPHAGQFTKTGHAASCAIRKALASEVPHARHPARR